MSVDTPDKLFATAWSGEAPEPGWAERRLTRDAHSATAFIPQAARLEDSGGAIHEIGVAELLAAYASGRLNPPEVIRHLERRIGERRSGLGAVLASIPGAEVAAAESAKRIGRGEARPLEGVPFGVKDIIDAAGAPVTCGSLLTGERFAATDAVVVARLRAAGAIPFVMTATTEFACGSAHNRRYGAVPNPWNAERWTGGSSTGSGAGLASRLFPLALGTDTGGSIRVPSAWCGVTGLKPTRGLVPRTGVAPLSWTLDHIGPMARSADDLALVMPHIAGPDGEDFLCAGAFDGGRARRDLHGVRIGVPSGWLIENVDAAVLSAWEGALKVFETAGGTLIPVDLGPMERVVEDGYTILFCELATLQEPSLDQRGLLDAGTLARLEQGLTYKAADYLRAMRLRPMFQAQALAAMAEVDVLATPGVGAEAGYLEDLTASVNGARRPFAQVVPRNTMPFNYTGQPALMLPSGLSADGLPVAIQIVGKLYDDALCLSVGSMFQKLTGHHLNAPREISA